MVTPFFGCAGANRLRSEKEVEEDFEMMVKEGVETIVEEEALDK